VSYYLVTIEATDAESRIAEPGIGKIVVPNAIRFVPILGRTVLRRDARTIPVSEGFPDDRLAAVTRHGREGLGVRCPQNAVPSR